MSSESKEDELRYVRQLLKDMVNQHCEDRQHGGLFSGFISINAEVMSYLGECGLIEVTNDNGGRVVEAKATRTTRELWPRCHWFRDSLQFVEWNGRQYAVMAYSFGDAQRQVWQAIEFATSTYRTSYYDRLLWAAWRGEQ